MPQVLEGYLDETLVVLGPQGVAAVAHGGAQHRTHRGPSSCLHSQHVHRLLNRSGCPAPYHIREAA